MCPPSVGSVLSSFAVRCRSTPSGSWPGSASALAAAEIPLLAISTFDTDYVLVREARLSTERGSGAARAAGYAVRARRDVVRRECGASLAGPSYTARHHAETRAVGRAGAPAARIGRALADTYPRQPGIDAIHYVFRLTVGDASNEIAGESTATLKVAAPGVREVFFDLASAAQGKGMTVTAVTSAAGPLQYTHAAGRLRIALPTPAAEGQETRDHRALPRRARRRPAPDRQHPRRADHVQRELAEPRTPVAADDRSSVRQGHGRVHRDRARALPGGRQRPARRRGRSAWKDFAARTGSSPCPSPPGSTPSASRASRPITTPSSAASRSRRGCFHRMREPGYETFELTGRRAFEFFSDWIGPYSYEKLAHVEAAGISGGMESASAIMYGEKGVTRGRAPVVHEVAHQWWGNAVTEIGLGRRVAERGLRDLLHAPVHRAVRWPRCLREGDERRHPGHPQDARREPRRARSSIATSPT